jgi:hypothetical protein
MKTRHKSDSFEHSGAEPEVLVCLNGKRRLSLHSKPLTLNCGAQVKLDGFDKKRHVLCEVYAHLGVLKAGQRHKVAHDILKMLLVEKDQGGRPWRKICCFASKVPKELSGNSWLAHAAKQFHVKFEAVGLTPSTVASLEKAQRREAR